MSEILNSERELNALINQLDFISILRIAAIVATQEKLDMLMTEHLAARTGESSETIYRRLHSVSNQVIIASIRRSQESETLKDEN